VASWILHLSSETGWRGGERQVWLLARELARQGVGQMLAAPRGSPLAERVGELGIPVMALAPGVLGLARGGFAVARALRRRPGAILHAHSSPALDSARALRRCGPVAAVVHTRRVAFAVRAARKYRAGADRYVAISRAVADGLLGAGTPRERLSIIPSGVDFAALDAAPAAAPPFPDGDVVVGCVAQLTAEKGVVVLAQAWRHVARVQPTARLVLIGDGPRRAEVVAALAGAPSALVAGWRDDVAACLKRMDIYVQPSLQEGLGSTAIDAAALGLGLVVSRTGGLPEVIDDGAAGVLARPGDADALAQALIALIGDVQRRRELGARARSYARARFSCAAMAASYHALYRDLGLA